MLSKVDVQLSPALALLESDVFYFELAAKRMTLTACEIAFVPDLISLPVSCVAQRVDEKLACAEPTAFIKELEDACNYLCTPLARLYLHENSIALEKKLTAVGFHAKVEMGFLTKPTDKFQLTEGVRISQVVSEDDWHTKLEVHRLEDVGSDGYQNQAEDWNELMFRKCQTGFKKTFLIRYHGVPVGSIGIVESPGMRRVKNLFVAPEYRGLGLAASAVKLLLCEAARQSIPIMGVFGIEGSTGCSVYRSCGFEPATQQIEYTKRLDLTRFTNQTPRNPR